MESRERMWVCRIAAVAVLVVTIFAINGHLFSGKKRISAPSDVTLLVNITIVENAVRQGAVCLDGTPPAYHLDKGSGSGAKNWLVFLEGGAWCSSHEACMERSKTSLGSSSYMPSQMPFSGILGSSREYNPDFYNWNRVYVKYCDGASFAGNAKEQTRGLYYRGQRIWRAIISDLLQKGLRDAENALLTGCSAGGLATIIHCNSFQEFLPGVSVKCLSDGGYFMDVEDVSGTYTFRSFYKDVVDLQNARESLPSDCVSKYDAQCFFPHYILPYIQVPFFFVNPGYDIWQIQYVLVPDSADTDMHWYTCKLDPYSCSESQLKIFEKFRLKLLDSIKQIKGRHGWNMFIDSCFAHCQTTSNKTWNHVRVGDKTIMEAVGDWYFNRVQVKGVDCAYPCNPTCVKWDGWLH